MPQLYQQQVNPDRPRDIRLGRTLGGELAPFYQELSRTAERMGETASRGFAIMAANQRREDDVTVRTRAAQWQGQLNALETDLLSRRQLQAEGVVEEFNEQWDKLYSKMSEGLSDRQKALFDAVTQPSRPAHEARVEKHYVNERRSATVVANGQLRVAASDAVLLSPDDNRYSEAKAVIQQTIASDLEFLRPTVVEGETPTEDQELQGAKYETMLKRAVAEELTAVNQKVVLMQLQSNNVDGARAWLDAHAGDINPAVRAELETKIRRLDDGIGAVRMSDRAIASAMDDLGEVDWTKARETLEAARQSPQAAQDDAYRRQVDQAMDVLDKRFGQMQELQRRESADKTNKYFEQLADLSAGDPARIDLLLLNAQNDRSVLPADYQRLASLAGQKTAITDAEKVARFQEMRYALFENYQQSKTGVSAPELAAMISRNPWLTTSQTTQLQAINATGRLNNLDESRIRATWELLNGEDSWGDMDAEEKIGVLNFLADVTADAEVLSDQELRRAVALATTEAVGWNLQTGEQATGPAYQISGTSAWVPTAMVSGQDPEIIRAAFDMLPAEAQRDLERKGLSPGTPAAEAFQDAMDQAERLRKAAGIMERIRQGDEEAKVRGQRAKALRRGAALRAGMPQADPGERLLQEAEVSRRALKKLGFTE